MTANANEFFKNKKVNTKKLIDFGFELENKKYYFESTLPSSGFNLSIIISTNGSVSTELIDPSTNEIYTLHLSNAPTGKFVAEIRHEYDALLKKIAKECFEKAAFTSKQAKEVLAYIADKYGDELEFLWEKNPNSAIYRHQSSQKWYGLVTKVSKRKLGISSNKVVEIINLKNNENIADNEKYYPAYHMSKKNWITIILDESVPNKDLFQKIDLSYDLTK